MKVALVHDWLAGYGGAERVLMSMHELYPDAPVYTSLYHPERMPDDFCSWDIRSSFLQKLPHKLQKHQALLPLMPLAFEAFDLNDYDLVLSSSHACAKGVITGPQTLHIAYLHTPIRYAWDLSYEYLRQSNLPKWKQALAHPLLHYIRLWDQLNTQRIDHLLCNSHFVKQRIAKYYRREAHVLYPPVDIPAAQPQRDPQDFYLAAGRLVAYKRVDLIVETFNQNQLPLRILGNGPEYARLKQKARSNIQFLGEVSRETLELNYRQARALLFAPLEDFGIVPVEAQAFGCPVIAYGRGGACETVKHQETGVLFAEQNVPSLQAAIEQFEQLSFKPELLYQHAQQFAAARFQTELHTYVAQSLKV